MKKPIILTKRTCVNTADKAYEFSTEDTALKQMPEIRNWSRSERSSSVGYYSPDWIFMLEYEREYYKNWKPNMPTRPSKN